MIFLLLENERMYFERMSKWFLLITHDSFSHSRKVGEG